MKKVSNILLLVGSIISIIIAVSMILMAVCCFAISSSTEAIKEFLKQYVDAETDFDPYLQIAKVYMIISGVVFAIIALLDILLSVFAKQARQPEAKHSEFVLNIVFGVLAGNSICVAGGITGLIAESKQKKNAAEVIE